MVILHTCINVADADESADWYTSQLGLNRSWEFTTDDNLTRNVYISDDNGFEIQLCDTKGEDHFKRVTEYGHLAKMVENVDIAFDDIDHYGVEKPPTDQPAANARTAFVRDPDGYLVELVETLDG